MPQRIFVGTAVANAAFARARAAANTSLVGESSWEEAASTTVDAAAGMRGLFGLAESYGAALLPASLLVERCGRAVVDTLVALGIVGPACRATAHPCGDDRRGCMRRVTAEDGDAALPLVAVCERVPARCEAVRLSEEACREHAISLRALELALGALFEVHPTVSRRDPPLEKLGVQRGPGRERDILVAWQPVEPAFSLAIRLRETIDRPALVLVPTRGGIAPDVARAHGPRSRVEIVALDEVLALEQGEIVRRETVANGKRAPRIVVTHGNPLKLAVLRAWRELAIYRDGDSDEIVVICIGRTCVRASYIDLGMVCANTRKPNEAWRSLMWLCNEHGVFRPYGNSVRIRKRASVLRKHLCAIFGLDEDPFARPSRRDGWKAKFRAYSCKPDEALFKRR